MHAHAHIHTHIHTHRHTHTHTQIYIYIYIYLYITYLSYCEIHVQLNTPLTHSIRTLAESSPCFYIPYLITLFYSSKTLFRYFYTKPTNPTSAHFGACVFRYSLISTNSEGNPSDIYLAILALTYSFGILFASHTRGRGECCERDRVKTSRV